MGKVDLVAEQEELSMLINTAPALLKPARQVVESLLARHLINQYGTSGIAVESLRDTLELLLSSCVPKLKADDTIVHDHLPGPEINPHRGLRLKVK